MLTLWGRRSSVNVQKPMWLMGELNLQVEQKDVGGAFGGLDTADYIALNPHQLIPTLTDDKTTVWESEAVLRYLGSQYGEQYFPAQAADRAQIDQWMSWVQSTWAPAMTDVFVSHIRVAREARNAETIKAQIAKLHKLAGLADKILTNRDFLGGNSLSLADFSFGSFLYRYYTLEISRPDLPALAAYYKRLCDRPAYVKHVHIDYDSMRVPGAERS